MCETVFSTLSVTLSSFGGGYVTSVRFLTKSQLHSGGFDDYVLVKQYPEEKDVSFSNSEDLYLGLPCVREWTLE